MATYQVETEGGTYQINTEEQAPQQPSFMKQLGQAFATTPNRLIQGAVEPIVKSFGTAGLGVNELIGNKVPEYDIPFLTGPIHIGNMKTMPQAVGLGLQGSALATGLGATGGAMYGAGSALEQGKSGRDIAISTLIGTGIGAAGDIASGGTDAILSTINSRSDIAGALINSLIKPVDKAFRYHGNPGMVVAKEGLWDATLPGLKTKIKQRMGEINNKINTIKSGIDYSETKIPLDDIFEPITEQSKLLDTMPLSNKESLAKLKNALDDFRNMVKNEKIDLSNATLEDAYKIKNAVNNITDWEKTAVGDNFVNTSAKKVYRKIDDKIDKAVPPLKEYNDRMRGLIDADKSITRRINAEQRRGLIGMPAMGAGVIGAMLGHAPGAAVGVMGEMLLESPAFKTSLAKLLAEKYPALSKSI